MQGQDLLLLARPAEEGAMTDDVTVRRAAAVVVVFRCGGFAVRWVPRSVACVGTWVLAVLLAGLCVVVARAADVPPTGARRPHEASR